MEGQNQIDVRTPSFKGQGVENSRSRSRMIIVVMIIREGLIGLTLPDTNPQLRERVQR